MIIVSKRFVHFDEMTWPRALEDDNDSVQWRLRYANPNREDIIYAASVMAAYSALIYKPARARNKIIAQLKKVES